MRKTTARKRKQIKIAITVVTATVFSCGIAAYVIQNVRQPAVSPGMDFSSKEIFLQLKDSQKIKNKKNIEASYQNMYLLSFRTEKETEDMYHYYKDKAVYIDTDAGMSAANSASAGQMAASFEANPIASLKKEIQKAKPVERKTIVLIDTGVSETKPADARYTVIGGSVYDENGHGDQMVDAIKSENPDANIVSIKALDKNGNGTSASIYAAVKLAESMHADIINLSLSSKDAKGTAVVKGVLEEAAKNGCTIVASAGNDGTNSTYTTPGNVEHALIVGSCDKDGERLSNSNYGDLVDYNMVSGSTSEACAKMSGYLSKHTAVIPDNTVIFQPDQETEDADATPEAADTNASEVAQAGDTDDLYDGNMLSLDTENLKEGESIEVKGKAEKNSSGKTNEEGQSLYTFAMPDQIGALDTAILNSSTGSNQLPLELTGNAPSENASVTVTNINRDNIRTSAVTMKISAPTEDGRQAEGTFTFKTRMEGNRIAAAASDLAEENTQEEAEEVHPDFSSMRLILDTDPSNLRPEDPVIGSYGNLCLIQYDTEEAAENAWKYYKSKEIPVQADTKVTLFTTGESEKEKTAGSEKTSAKMTRENNPFTALAKAAGKAELSTGSIAILDAGTPDNDAVVDRVFLIGDSASKDKQAQKQADQILAENKDAQIVSIQALDADGTGYVSSILAGALYAKEVNADYAGISISSDTRGDDAVSSRVFTDTASSGVLILSTPNDLGVPAGDEVTVGVAGGKNTAETDVSVKAESAPEAVSRLAGILSREGAVQPEAVSHASKEIEVNPNCHLFLENGKPTGNTWSVQEGILVVNGRVCGNQETDETGKAVENRWISEEGNEEEKQYAEYIYSPEEDTLEKRVLTDAD